MKISQEKTKGLTFSCTAVIDAAEFETEVQARIARLAKGAKLPGFRPGKAPVAMLNQKYRGAALGEVLDDMVQKSVRDIIRQKDLRVAMEPEVKLSKFEDGKDIEFTMEVETLPEIKLGDFSKIKLGAKVSHPKFGDGVISEITPNSSNHCVKIKFDTVGEKMLSLEYAPIEFKE